MNSLLKLAAILVLAAGIVLWFFRETETPEAQNEPSVAMPAEPEPAAVVEQYPVPEFVQERPTDLVPLPDLRDSDAYFKLELTNLFGSGFAALLRESGGIERFVVTIDNLPRSRFAERLRPLEGPPGAFRTIEQENGRFTIDPENSQRYVAYVDFLTRASDDEIVDVYRRFYPLLQEAYIDLGYPDGFFNDRVVEVIDNLLATPDLTETPRLIRPHVLYEFEDKSLESLSFGQKALLRTGPENATVIKRRLREIRRRLIDLQ